jgi:hypothetical protein
VSQLLKDRHSPCFISVAVQTTPLDSDAPYSPPCSPPTILTRTRLSPAEARNGTEDFKARIDLFSNAINDFTRERRTTRDTLEQRRKPTAAGSGPSPARPPFASYDSRISSVPPSPSQYQLPPELPLEPPSSQPPLHKTLPDFQHILLVEQECLR